MADLQAQRLNVDKSYRWQSAFPVPDGLIHSGLNSISINGFQSFSCQGPPKLHVIWPPEPSSQNVSFQGQPPTNKDLSEKPIRREYIFKCARVSSIFQK